MAQSNNDLPFMTAKTDYTIRCNTNLYKPPVVSRVFILPRLFSKHPLPYEVRISFTFPVLLRKPQDCISPFKALRKLLNRTIYISHR